MKTIRIMAIAVLIVISGLALRAQQPGTKHTNPQKAIPDKVKGGQAMKITSIHYTFLSEDADKAETLFQELRDASVKEPGVVQFEVVRSSEDPNIFALWEVYRDKDAVDAHLASEHFKRLVLNGIRPLAKQRDAVTATLMR
jgi:quinol monooxygenase YgiN